MSPAVDKGGFEYIGYIWVVPFVEMGEQIFLKTLYPSRKYTKMYKSEKIKMRAIKLTSQERAVEDALLKGEYISVNREKFDEIAKAIAARRKDAVLNIRLNSRDLRQLKLKVQRLGLRYQTFISEILHRIAQAS